MHTGRIQKRFSSQISPMPSGIAQQQRGSLTAAAQQQMLLFLLFGTDSGETLL